MSVALPQLPWQADVRPRLVRFGSDLTPALGGPVARINRLGSRYAVDVDLPTLQADMGPLWIAARLQAEATNTTLTLTWPSAYYETSTTAQVNGDGQAGTSLAIGAMAPGAVIPALIPFSFELNNRNYLHLTTAAATVGAPGTAVLSIAPMLRVSPPAGTAINFSNPTIEGLIDGATIDWELQLSRYHKLSFTLTENA